jgi:hypothetical protein
VVLEATTIENHLLDAKLQSSLCYQLADHLRLTRLGGFVKFRFELRIERRCCRQRVSCRIVNDLSIYMA